MRADSLLIPVKKSYNFSVAGAPTRDTPLQKYYVNYHITQRFNYDAEHKRFSSSDRLVPLSKTNTHTPQQEIPDKIVTHSTQAELVHR